jgi:hypothetical protein
LLFIDIMAPYRAKFSRGGNNEVNLTEKDGNMLWHRFIRSTTLTFSLGVLLAAGGLAQLASAATISYGNFGPVAPGITFVNVTESSGTDPLPLFGPPDPFSVGLDFDPTSFVSTANGGAQDVTDGQLNFIIQGSSGVAIDQFSLFEGGDYTLAGTGTSATQALAGAIVSVVVTQVDGVDIAPVSLGSSNASVAFNLAANPGVVQPWSLGLSYDVDAQLTSKGIPFSLGATELEVVVNNQLLTFSQTSSLAFIAKKDFRIDIDTEVPEPATAMMLLGSCLAIGAIVRRARA